jgi:error-prone DNA polymerase
VHLVAERLFDRSDNLKHLANDALGGKPALLTGTAEPLHDDRRDHPGNPAQRIRHPRNVRILPRSRDFH